MEAASRRVIARWIKTIFEREGINAPPGSVRPAVASIFLNLLPLDEFLNKGNWRSEVTFLKHCFKEISRVDLNSKQRPNSLNSSFNPCCDCMRLLIL